MVIKFQASGHELIDPGLRKDFCPSPFAVLGAIWEFLHPLKHQIFATANRILDAESSGLVQ